MSELESSSDDEGSNFTSSQSQDDHQVFAGLSAWFSESVESGWIEDWRSYGGEITDVENAQFLFSENCESQDTVRIYESDQFRSQHVAVIHALYIDECLKERSVDAVPIGLYYLPPKEVQEALTGEKSIFKWQLDSQKEPSETLSSRVNVMIDQETDMTRTNSSSTSNVEPNKIKKSSSVSCRPERSRRSNSVAVDTEIARSRHSPGHHITPERTKRCNSEKVESCRLRSILHDKSQGHVDKSRPRTDEEDNLSMPGTFSSTDSTEDEQERIPHVSELKLASGEIILVDAVDPTFNRIAGTQKADKLHRK